MGTPWRDYGGYYDTPHRVRCPYHSLVLKSIDRVLLMVYNMCKAKEKGVFCMIIDTDISCVSSDGILGKITCYSPIELLDVMKKENVSSCSISVSTMGQNLMNTQISLLDVEKWIKMNEKGVI